MQPQTDAGAKEKTRVATTVPAVFTRVSSTISVGMSSNNFKYSSKAEGSHWLTLISSC